MEAETTPTTETEQVHWVDAIMQQRMSKDKRIEMLREAAMDYYEQLQDERANAQRAEAMLVEDRAGRQRMTEATADLIQQMEEAHQVLDQASVAIIKHQSLADRIHALKRIVREEGDRAYAVLDDKYDALGVILNDERVKYDTLVEECHKELDRIGVAAGPHWTLPERIAAVVPFLRAGHERE